MSDEKGGLPPDRLWQPTTAKYFAAIFGGSLVYAIVRYHLAGDVPWAHFPLFIFNKATSLAAVFFVACSYLVGKVIRWHDEDKRLRLVVIKFCGLFGFHVRHDTPFTKVSHCDPLPTDGSHYDMKLPFPNGTTLGVKMYRFLAKRYCYWGCETRKSLKGGATDGIPQTRDRSLDGLQGFYTGF